MGMYKNKVWVFHTDYSSFLYCRFIVINLISHFPVNQREAINLINSFWSRLGEVVEGDMMYHELPEFWSSEMYWGNDSMWWKKGDDRIKYNLSEGKPLRSDKETKYELWKPEIQYSTDYIEDYLFIENKEVKELVDNQLLIGQYYKKWEVTAPNYIVVLDALHRYKGWGKYRESQ